MLDLLLKQSNSSSSFVEFRASSYLFLPLSLFLVCPLFSTHVTRTDITRDLSCISAKATQRGKAYNYDKRDRVALGNGRSKQSELAINTATIRHGEDEDSYDHPFQVLSITKPPRPILYIYRAYFSITFLPICTCRDHYEFITSIKATRTRRTQQPAGAGAAL